MSQDNSVLMLAMLVAWCQRAARCLLGWSGASPPGQCCRDWKGGETARERQRRAFAYGNAKIENPRITRAMINRAANDAIL